MYILPNLKNLERGKKFGRKKGKKDQLSYKVKKPKGGKNEVQRGGGGEKRRIEEKGKIMVEKEKRTRGENGRKKGHSFE